MKILAVDPGPKKHAWVMWDTETHDFCGGRFGEDILSDDCGGRPGLVAIEFPQSYGVNAGLSLFLTAFQAGRIAGRYDDVAPVMLCGRPTIKGQIGGRNDAEIRRSLMMRLGGTKKGEKLYGVKGDIWPALALAVALDENPKLKRVEW